MSTTISTEDPVPSAPAPRAGRRVLRLALSAGVAAVVVAGVALASADPGTGPTAPDPGRTAVAAAAPVTVPTVGLVGLSAGRVPWSAPLRLAVTDGTLTAVTVLGPDGAGVAGELTATGWTSSATLLPDARYTATATATDSAGGVHALPLTATTTAADRLLTARLSPGDDALVGVGRPVQVSFDRDVTEPAARAALVGRMTVAATPATPGAWRWMDARTVHWRPAVFWRPGTKVAVKVDLQRLALPDGVWGSGGRTTLFTIGDAVVSTVDVAAHTMTVRRDGQVLRVMKASMGRPQFATRNGTFLVLEKQAKRVMDSATVNLPPGTPAYKTAVESAVRLSNSGTFTHGAPWSVADQGVRNVSHGCVNLSPSDARWFYELARRGDVVQVVGSTRGPLPHDSGSQDWNMSFDAWKA